MCHALVRLVPVCYGLVFHRKTDSDFYIRFPLAHTPMQSVIQ